MSQIPCPPQVTTGKTVYILLSGSAYTDSYSVKLATVPLLARNPSLTVRIKWHFRPMPEMSNALPSLALSDAHATRLNSSMRWKACMLVESSKP